MKLAIKICLWILAFVPVIVDHGVFSPYSSGKNLMIESSLVLAGILILINFFYSKGFREEVVDKAVKYIKHPLVIAILAFVLINIISTIFAVDKYAAFWGDINKAEGLSGLIFFFSFFVFTLLTFEKRDWLWFFKLSLFTSFILLSKEFIEYFHDGIDRPSSYIGNPTFLAGYLLFSIASGFMVLNEIKSNIFKYLSIIVIALSAVGILIAQTRGTVLGLALGIVAALVYSAFKGKDINYKIFNLRKVAIILLSVGIIFSGIFAVTRKNEVWQKVPGLSRLAVISNDGLRSDTSTSVRFYLYQTALESVNPSQSGWRKLFLGWGPENYIVADSKYYNPDLYKYEIEWHDRSHNKFLDVLVMNGLFGLLIYLAIWFTFFKFLYKKSAPRSLGEVGLDISLLIFGVSYLTHLMFVFDQISTSIPFFMILAFVTYLTTINPPEQPKSPEISIETKGKHEILAMTFLVVLTLFLAFVLFRNTLPGYFQMRNYIKIINNSGNNIIAELEPVYTPFTTAQNLIRRNLLQISFDNFINNKNPNSFKLLNEGIRAQEEYITKCSYDVIAISTLAGVYSTTGNIIKNVDYINKGEELLLKTLNFAPNRPDINYQLGVNLFYQKKYTDSFLSFEKTFLLSPEYYGMNKGEIEGPYLFFIKYFYEQKDKENFIKAVNRLKINNYEDSVSLDKILAYLDKYGVWPRVDFK